MLKQSPLFSARKKNGSPIKKHQKLLSSSELVLKRHSHQSKATRAREQKVSEYGSQWVNMQSDINFGNKLQRQVTEKFFARKF